VYRVAITAIVLLLVVGCLGQENTPAPPPDQPGSARHEHDRANRPGVAGTITAMDDKSMTLKTLDGRTVNVKLDDKTQYRKDRQPAKLSDFKVGDMAFVGGQSTGENTWQANFVAMRSGGQEFREDLGKRFIAGEIKSINGTQLTITRVDGETQTINVDENTSFRKQGESVTLADLKPGDHVFGRGEVKNDVFVPAVLNVGEPGRMRMGPPQGKSGDEPR
jgi:Domain of unknown function (DUF5666)